MKKLLLIINCIISILIIDSCQASKKNETSKVAEKSTSEKIITDTFISNTIDSGEYKKANFSNTKKSDENLSIKSELKTTNSNGSSNTQSGDIHKNNTTHVINHGSDNQTTLDSIKDAKAKNKK